MAEEWKPLPPEILLAPKIDGIDALPHLGAILNSLEWVILSQGGILKQLCTLVAKNNLMTPELDAAMSNAYKAEVTYGALKDALMALPKKPE